MKFQVPQFIEIEDKIFGPLTFKQFVYLAGGGGLCFIIYNLFPVFITIILIIPIALLSAGLAFYKLNNKTLIEIIEYYFKYTLANKLYVWKKEIKKEAEIQMNKKEKEETKIPTLSKGKLKSLSWNLDTKEKIRMN